MSEHHVRAKVRKIVRKKRKKHALTPEKARQILRDGQVNGRKLTEKQKRFFGLIAGGGTPTRTSA